MPSDLEFSWFKKKVKDLTGVNLDSYRPQQMQRILEKVLDKTGRRNYVDLVKYLQEKPAHIQEFRDAITINVSSLFRDKSRWDELNSRFTQAVDARLRDPRRSQRRRTVRVWSAGCSIGAEPYTLAILLHEMNVAMAPDSFPFTVLATDLDRAMLSRAREGIYTDRETREVPATLMKRYFKTVDRPASDWARNSPGDRFYEVAPALKEHVDFRQHNLLEDAWEQGYDLIVCRNVIIYFTNETKLVLFQKFSDALCDNGLLFIGGTEIVFRHERFNLESVGTGIYRKANPR